MYISSETGPLKKVLVHQPDYSLMRLTPTNCKDYLFDEVVWPERAKDEHKIFTTLLKNHGVEVLFIKTLLKTAISHLEAKQYLIKQYLRLFYYEHQSESLLLQYLNHLSIDELIQQLFYGITFNDIKPYSLGIISSTLKTNQFILPPMPNQLFTRDSSAWILNGLCLTKMAYPVRRTETIIMSTLYRYHPLFNNSNFPTWYLNKNTSQFLPSLEGGDIFVLNKHSLLIGAGQRTQTQAIELLAKRLFQLNEINQIIAVELPKTKSMMHLDTILAIIDVDTFFSFYPKLDFPCCLIRPGSSKDRLNLSKKLLLPDTLAQVLGLKKIRIVFPSGDPLILEREQWNDAANLLTVKPNVVISYEQNQLTNQALKQAGVEINTFPTSELNRGRGGPRCMSCPLERKDS